MCYKFNKLVDNKLKFNKKKHKEWRLCLIKFALIKNKCKNCNKKQKCIYLKTILT